ncbi:TetR/AcrR family transcriptional regulator [Rhodococcoides fascians]|uniref:TetR/AcrR family transcriptional regulator n=1 Tax=Rhodococcoides fascians TaxID=1828 RepID=UPI00068BF5A9|nr:MULTISPECIES: TetR/AcrR family transcriptional regulator [Rhodococcus]OZF04830.1 TetR/AcrR family transcriptional regulator [Rhodococcus sp. 15-1189-1-1a]OZF19094.1 TetR/AcrR family transcriptional regulator [Rhodococcus sp. 14-2686-1-2]
MSTRGKALGARDKLLLSTIDLMRRKGVVGTGVAEILEHGAVSRRSIYLHYPDGKSGLVAEATRLAGTYIEAQITAAAAHSTPREGLASFIAQWKNVVFSSEFTAGCPIAAAAVSRATTPAVADIAGAEFDRWRQTLATSLVEHGIEQSTAESLANTILAAVEGAVMMCVAQRSLTALDDVEQHLTVLLDHHLTQADPRRQR